MEFIETKVWPGIKWFFKANLSLNFGPFSLKKSYSFPQIQAIYDGIFIFPYLIVREKVSFFKANLSLNFRPFSLNKSYSFPQFHAIYDGFVIFPYLIVREKLIGTPNIELFH